MRVLSICTGMGLMDRAYLDAGYEVVAGRIYGPKRGAKLQGYPAAAELPFPCVTLQHGLADAVPYPLALAWANSIRSAASSSQREQEGGRG